MLLLFHFLVSIKRLGIREKRQSRSTRIPNRKGQISDERLHFYNQKLVCAYSQTCLNEQCGFRPEETSREDTLKGIEEFERT
jgi:hypothetical protein